MLDQAFESLKKFDWGTPIGEVSGIDDAVIASHAAPALRKDVERRLIAALASDVSSDAKDYVCRKLAMIGSAAAVPALGGLLTDETHSHLARHALERIPGPEAAAALQGALAKVDGKLKIGVIGSLAARRETGAVPALAALLKDADPAVARSATLALGTIGGDEAVRALQAAVAGAGKDPGDGKDKATLIDSLLSCAESLLAGRKPVEAAAIYKSLTNESQPRLVRLAATRGMLACLGDA